MATTKWNDPTDWVFADWSDESKTVLFNHLWDALKGKADEQVAFSRAIHDSSFAAVDTFPDFNTLMSLYLSGGGSPSNRFKIESSIYPEDCVQTDEINTSGTDHTSPETLNLTELLTDVLSYSSGTLLGKANGLPMQSWQKQYFEVMNYPEFYWRPALREAGGADEDWISLLEVQRVEAHTIYKYNPTTSTFTSAVCNTIRTESSGNVIQQVYVANDLNESSPFSTPQEVRDYTIGILEGFRDDSAVWQGVNNLSQISGIVKASIEELITDDPFDSGDVTIECDLTSFRFRFKLNDQYRATSPNRYIAPIQNNFYYGTPTVWDDFGTGETEDVVHLDTLTKDGSDYFYYEIVDPDYDNTSVLTIPTASTVEQEFAISLVPIPPTNVSFGHGYYVKPNQDDGTAFEYYTP